MNAKVKLVQSWSAGNLLKERQSRLLQALNVLPSTRNRSQILHVRFSGRDMHRQEG